MRVAPGMLPTLRTPANTRAARQEDLAEAIAPMNSGMIQGVKFDERGLIPAIFQDASTSDVIGLYHMDNECLVRTLRTGQAIVLDDSAGAVATARFRLVDVRVTAEGGALSVLVESTTGPDGQPGGVSLLREPDRGASAEVSLVD